MNSHRSLSSIILLQQGTKIEFLSQTQSQQVYQDVMREYQTPTLDAGVLTKLLETFDETDLTCEDGFWEFVRVLGSIAQDKDPVLRCVLKAVMNL
jgi:hypothetical protein